MVLAGLHGRLIETKFILLTTVTVTSFLSKKFKREFTRLLTTELICSLREDPALLQRVFFLSLGLLFMDLKTSPLLMGLMVMNHDHTRHGQDGLDPPWRQGQPKGGNPNASKTIWVVIHDNMGDNLGDKMNEDNMG